jgi:GrpB-like predicted nucleotidyltransferase (UPF0157 family)
MGAMESGTPTPLRIVDYDVTWPYRFEKLGRALREQLGAVALRIDHVGSTAVPGLAAKDVIDIQVTVASLEIADAWPDELLPQLLRTHRGAAFDHVPPGLTDEVGEWTKHLWSMGQSVNVHVREEGRLNQRYALLFRDYLRADTTAAGAYEMVKRALAGAAPDDWDLYYAVKDPACDLIIAGAEQWALRTGWTADASGA